MREIPSKDFKSEAIVLKRTNYGEADRILQIITPAGKMAVMAKAVRKEKSRLAGGIEMFCLSDIVLHKGNSDLSVLTSAKMKEFYKGILADLDRIELASEILKKISRAADMTDSEDYFSLAKQCLTALDKHANSALIEAWFYLNLANICGEQVNIITDTRGEKLQADQQYTWDSTENALRVAKGGKIGANEIKMMRLMLSADLSLILRVAGKDEMAGEILYIAKAVNQI